MRDPMILGLLEESRSMEVPVSDMTHRQVLATMFYHDQKSYQRDLRLVNVIRRSING